MGLRTVILHIGIHKTGTSSIQDAFAGGRAALRAAGILYPASLPANHSHFLYNAFSAAPERYHANIAHGRGRAEVAADVARVLAALRAEIAACRAGDAAGERR